ncbi:MAG: AraC family transcriptional regulator [Acidobacteriota bacterium]|nr:AraC family transcriptional regulator [Acidobacteriota bacterium]
MLKKLAPGCSNGKVLKSFDTAGFIMTEVAYSAQSRLAEHSHENAHFCFVLQGTYTESHNRQELECAPSTLTFRPPGEVHEDKFHNQEVRVFTIEIPPRWMQRLEQDSIYLGRSVNFKGDSVTRLSERIVREFRRMDTAAGLIIEGLTLEIMAETARRAAQKNGGQAIPYWLKRAKELLHARFSENLTLEHIAAQVGVHPVHLSSVFRRKYHCTVGEYIRQLRIEYACREIAKGEMPLAIIALEAGFANQGHFSAAFKRLTGLTPAAYRNFSRQS